MVSVYMPDERISMFPYALSTELLSLGAGVDSYALSCGVTLNEQGNSTYHASAHHLFVASAFIRRIDSKSFQFSPL